MPITEEIYSALSQRLSWAARRASHLRSQRPAAKRLETPLPVSYASLLKKAENCVTRRERRFARMAGALWSPAEMYASPLFQRGSDSLEDRHAIVDRIRADTQHFKPRPHAFQIEVIEFWLELSAPYIYGEFWQTNYVDIRTRNGWSTPNNGIGAVRSGRKDGKSTAIAMCVVLGLFNLPNYTIALFAKVHKQSRIILGMALQLARTHPRAKEFIIPRPSCDKFTVRVSLEDERVVSAHSGDPEVRLLFVYFCFFRVAPPSLRAFFVAFFLTGFTGAWHYTWPRRRPASGGGAPVAVVCCQCPTRPRCRSRWQWSRCAAGGAGQCGWPPQSRRRRAT